jgi:PPP family 3-phenylpropionic acid transporter
VLIIAQLLHAATFGVFHAAGIHFVHHRFPKKLLGRGQALYSSFSFGIGGTVGSLSSGYLWEYSSPLITFISSACFALFAFFLIYYVNRSNQLTIDRQSLL